MLKREALLKAGGCAHQGQVSTRRGELTTGNSTGRERNKSHMEEKGTKAGVTTHTSHRNPPKAITSFRTKQAHRGLFQSQGYWEG